MTSYFANTFTATGLFHLVPHWDPTFHILLVRGAPQSSVTIFLNDLLSDLKIHDIPVDAYTSCIYPDTPDILIIPSLKRVILNENNLANLLTEIETSAADARESLNIECLDLTRFCNSDSLQIYEQEIRELEEKVEYYQKQAVQFLRQLTEPFSPAEPMTSEMLFLLQSLFPVTAENKGKPARVMASALTSAGLLSNLQEITSGLKRRYILHGSANFLRTFFKLVESRAENLKMACQLIVNPLNHDLVEGVVFPNEKQAVLIRNKCYTLTAGFDDVELFFGDKKPQDALSEEGESEIKSAISALVKAHSYREEMDEFYWYTTDLDQIFFQRRRVMHQLLALCDGQELWQYFVK